jgi:hypothetical protein
MTQDIRSPTSFSSVSQRRAALGLASLCTLTLLGGIAGSFHDAARLDWLVPTSANLAAVENCHQISRPDAQRQCLERVVASAKSRHSLMNSLARSDTGGPLQGEEARAR